MNILKKYLFLILGSCGFLFGLFMVFYGERKPPIPPIEFPPPQSPYKHFVAGAGIIEASSENIAIGSPFIEVVEDVFVQAGDLVKKGDPLFLLDIRGLKAKLNQAFSDQNTAIANLEKLFQEPRPETLPPLEAQVQQALNRYKEEQIRLQFYENVQDKRAVSKEEYTTQMYTTKIAEYHYQQLLKELELLQAGTWDRDIDIAKAQLEQTSALIQAVQTEIERSLIRAPIDGEILKVDIRVGERSPLASSSDPRPMIVMGSIVPFHIRVDVDEEDAWRIRANRPATAFVRGNSKISTPLQFVRIEPYIIPKRSLTGDDIERVDTRVLQVIYSFDKKDLPIYIGQIMDVFIEAEAYPDAKEK